MARIHNNNENLSGNPDAALWSAVVLQALADATNRHGRDRDRQQAIRWFTKPSADFHKVCALAGLDPDATRERAAEAIAKAEAMHLAHPHPPRERKLTVPGRPARLIEHEGLALTTREWADRKGIPVATLNARLAKGWSVDVAINMPVNVSKQGARRPGGASNTLSAD